MGKIELRRSFIGSGLTGEVQLEPTLSWRDRLALQQTADATRDVASAVVTAGEAAVSAVVMAEEAVRTLEYEIGLRLDAQTTKLERQVDLLTEIAESLRTPARVRAAEKVASTAELLRRGRYRRALEAAEQAIQDDPNNAEAFTAVAWAQMGLGNLEPAREAFLEAALASDGDDKSGARRAAARLTFAIDGAAGALHALPAPAPDCSETERAAVHYDRTIYLAESGDQQQASSELHEAGRLDVRHCLAALEDPQLAPYEALRRVADAELARRHSDLVASNAALHATLDAAEERLARADTVGEGFTLPYRQDAVRVIDAARQQIEAARRRLETEYENACRSLAAFLSGEIQREVNAAERQAISAESYVVDRVSQIERLEREALRIANEVNAVPYLIKDGTWHLSYKKRGRTNHVRLWLDETGTIQRSDV
jgi:tetratricopeptide (TPR) repeat protein